MPAFQAGGVTSALPNSAFTTITPNCSSVAGRCQHQRLSNAGVFSSYDTPLGKGGAYSVGRAATMRPSRMIDAGNRQFPIRRGRI